jgi:hypothetical protein
VCPTLVHENCTTWLREVETAVPTIVVSVRSAAGVDVTDAEVTLDGRSLPTRRLGTPVELDPGRHLILARRSGAGRVERTVIVSAGEKNRRVVLTLPNPPRRAAAAGVSETPVWPYWVGGLGVIAIGAGVTLDVIGARRLQGLRDECAPTCSEGDVSSTRTTIIVGDSLIAGGVVALAVATYALVTGESHATR